MNNIIKTTHYKLLTSRNGDIVPAIIGESGEERGLHSLVDPKREAQRVVSSIPDGTGFVIFLGLGGGFYPEAALSLTGAQIVVIDFNKDSINELLSSKDYSTLLNEKRFNLLTDPSENEIKDFIIKNYNPVLCGGIKIIPLKTRTEHDTQKFNKAASAIQQAIDSVSSDYSVQAHFGMRWFSNIIHNIKAINASYIKCTQENNKEFLSKIKNIKEAAIAAAGPSLDQQINILSEYKSRNVFIICCDTALPVLLHHSIKPDAVVSIDCQHISHYHFFGIKTDIPLILDIASPPLLSGFTSMPVFFSSGHPLAQYVSGCWKSLPSIDTSGGNVTYACLSLAQALDIQRITLFGADFSYINSQTYARGVYIYPYFEKKQNRFRPLEAQASAFLYRTPFLPKEHPNQNYYETASLRFYRNKLEEKAKFMNCEIISAAGQGAPVKLPENKAPNAIKFNETNKLFSDTEETGKLNGQAFLNNYKNDISCLPPANTLSSTKTLAAAMNVKDYFNLLNENQRQVFTTLLPLAAAIKHRKPALSTIELIEEVKRYCVDKINSVINS